MRQAASLDFGNTSRVLNLPAPINPGDAVTKAYADALIEGLNWKDNARVATESNININAPGAILSTVVMAASDRVLVRGNTDQTQNGLYIYNSATSPMVRAKDGDNMGELKNAIISIDGGSDAGKVWRQVTIEGDIGTANIVFEPLLAVAPQATTTGFGTVRLANPTEVSSGTGTGIPNVTQIGLLPYAHHGVKAVIGDGTNNVYAVTHNLNSFDVMVQVRETNGDKAQVILNNKCTDANTIVLTSDAPVALNEFTVYVIKVV